MYREMCPEVLSTMIKKTKGGYKVVSEKTGRNLGKSKTLAGAKKRLRQVEWFKAHKGK